MNQKSFILKLVAVPLVALTALQFTACGDNPIEAENKKQVELSIDVDSALDSLESRRENMDYYSCYDKTKRFVDNYKKRCDNFIDRYRSSNADSVLSLSTIIRMVKDEDGYIDLGTDNVFSVGKDGSLIADTEFYWLAASIDHMEEQISTYIQDITHITADRERIEKEMRYPGQVRVSIIRETRAVDYAK